MSPRRWLPTALVLLSCWGGNVAVAEPYLAVRQNLPCIACHANPTGGGLRSEFGIAFAKNVLPAQSTSPLPDFSGKLADMLRIGADLRTNWSTTSVPNQQSQRKFALDQVRVYADVTLIPQKLGVYFDQLVAPGSAQNQEAYVRYGDPSDGWYLKGGRFYLPFGWRLQDSTAFVRQATGINMTAPDTGLEIGFEKAKWSGQLNLSNGVGNAGQPSGHQVTTQLVRLWSRWRLGAAASMTDSDLGDRHMAGMFAGLQTGPLAWLGEIDWIRDGGFPEGNRTSAAALGEVNWLIRRGHNLKLTGEFFDADRDVDENEQNRWSVLYEFTPLPFVQLRAGYRRYEGIPQNDLQNRRLTFIELHGFF